MAEWSNAAVLKTAEPETVPGFESLSFRHFLLVNTKGRTSSTLLFLGLWLLALIL